MLSYAEKAVNIAENRHEFVQLEDGLVYYWPSKEHAGAMAAAYLRAIADELDKRNEKWCEQMDKELGAKQ